MMAAIVVFVTFLGQLITLGIKIWDALKEKDEELKKKQTEAIQSGARAIIDKDVSRLNRANIDLQRLRK